MTERPNLEGIEYNILNDPVAWKRDIAASDCQELIAYIRHLESTQPKDGEPYIIEAGKFDPETMERQHDRDGGWIEGAPMHCEPQRLLVVRNKVREEEKPRFEASTLNAEGYLSVTDKENPQWWVTYARDE